MIHFYQDDFIAAVQLNVRANTPICIEIFIKHILIVDFACCNDKLFVVVCFLT